MRVPLTVAGVALALAPTAPLASAGPFVDGISPTHFVVGLADFAVIPGSPGSARMSVLTTDPAGRIFAMDQKGPIYLIRASGSPVTLYLDLATTPGIDLRRTNEQGLLSVAFHPQFQAPGTPGFGRFYTAHTTNNLTPPPDFAPGDGNDAGDNVVLEWRTHDPAAPTFIPADPAAPFRELLRIEAPFGNHTMGLIAFNPNSAPPSTDFGQLYIAVGDGGSSGDPFDLARNPANPYGSILRIDPLGSNSANGRYGIPRSNPFVGNANALDETFAYGLRNPQRFFWDRGGNGAMFIADIGQNVIEEINLGIPGANYGWDQREGSFSFPNSQRANSRRGDAATTGFTYPIAEYDHDEGNAITVGPVERSGLIPNLFGHLVFGDLVRGRIFILEADALPTGGPSGISELRVRYQGIERSFQSIINLRRPSANRADLRFGSDASGRIFLFNKQDNVIRLLTPTFVPIGPRPKVKILGKSRRTTDNRRINLRGRASDDGPIVRVEIKNARQKRGFTSVDKLSVNGSANWRDRVLLRPGPNALRVRAIDADGRKSRVDKVIVFRGK